MAKKEGLNYQSQACEVTAGTWPLIRMIGGDVLAIAVTDRDYAISFLGPNEKDLMKAWQKFAVPDDDEDEDTDEDEDEDDDDDDDEEDEEDDKVDEDHILSLEGNMTKQERLIDDFIAFYKQQEGT